MDVSTRARGVFLFGPFRLDPVRRTLLRNGVPVVLAPRLFDTLLHLVANHERLVEKGELIAAVWGRRTVEEANLSQAIFALRKVLQADGEDDNFIVTAPGRGYRCGVPVVFETAPEDRTAAGLFGEAGTNTQGVPTRTRPWWRRPFVVTVAAVALVLATSGGAVWTLRSASETALPAAAPPFAPPPHSVAVLAFTNLSGDPGQEYFSDGLSEELIDALGRIGAVRVAARQSSFSFKGKPVTITEIARQLNVGTVLEGSVRRDGALLRINAQLIDAATGYQLWSGHYDPDRGNMLKVQGDIAEAVTKALRVTLAGSDTAKLTLGGTTDAKAFDAYLRGMKLESPPTKDATQQSLAAFEEALAVDPGFVLAHVQHARMQIRIIQTFAGDDVALVHRYRAEALAELQHSVSLAPDFGVAHAILALALWESWSFVDAARELARAKELAPGDASVYRQYATFEVLLGNFGDAVAAVQRATELDPLSPGTYMTAAATLAWAGQPDAALVAIHHAQELGFNGTRVIDEIADTQLRKGNFQEAQRSCAAEADYFQHYCLAIADHRLGKQADAEAQLAKMQSAEGDNSAYLYAVVYASWGSADKALDWLEKAYSVHDDGLVGLRSDYLLAPLHGLARYQAVEREMKFPP